jgi:hypothetical protein
MMNRDEDLAKLELALIRIYEPPRGLTFKERLKQVQPNLTDEELEDLWKEN